MKIDSSENLNANSNFFTYDALNLLYDMNEFENIVMHNQNIETVLVPFKINLNGKHPFNTIMLVNNYNNCLDFVYLFNNVNKIENKDMLISSINCYLYSLFSTYKNNNVNNITIEFDKFIETIEFKGFYYFQEKIYIFIDLTKININISLVNKDDLYWFVLMDEILNKKNICNLEIHPNVIDFFMQNNDFIYLKNSQKNVIEIPSVVYTGTHDKSLYFNYIFGPAPNNSILGSGYYFTNFKNAIREGGWSMNYADEYKYGEKITDDLYGKYKKGGIVRYALFLGYNLVKLNYPNDVIDTSEIKQNKLNNVEDVNNYNYEKMILRVSDYDGLWKEKHDSVFLGKIELDNGELLKNTPIYVCKDYYSHIPLSYHYINKTILGDRFDENTNYEIL